MSPEWTKPPDGGLCQTNFNYTTMTTTHTKTIGKARATDWMQRKFQDELTARLDLLQFDLKWYEAQYESCSPKSGQGTKEVQAHYYEQMHIIRHERNELMKMMQVLSGDV